MITQVKHVGIAVSDMNRSIVFYRDVIGLQLKGRHMANPTMEIALLVFPGHEHVEIELIAGGEPGSGATGVVSHIALAVTDIEQEWDRLKNLHVPTIDDRPRSVGNGAKIGFFLGPDNERLELFQEAYLKPGVNKTR